MKHPAKPAGAADEGERGINSSLSIVDTSASNTTMTMSIAKVSDQFQQTRADYIATCHCGWTKRTRMGLGKLTEHRAAVAEHMKVHPSGDAQ